MSAEIIKAIRKATGGQPLPQQDYHLEIFPGYGRPACWSATLRDPIVPDDVREEMEAEGLIVWSRPSGEQFHPSKQ